MTRSSPSSLAVTPSLSADFTVCRPGFRLHVRLEVGAEIMVLFGPSGSGKTTTLNALAGLVAPERGRITLDGQTLFQRSDGTKTINMPARRRGMGYVFQQYALFPHLTARENVGFPLRGPDRQPRAISRAHRRPQVPFHSSGKEFHGRHPTRESRLHYADATE